MQQDIKQLHQQAQRALNQKNYQQAHGYLIRLLEQDKYFADGYFLLGIIAGDHHNIDKAIELIKQASVLAPENIEYLAQLAKQFALKNDHVNTLSYAKKSAAQLSKKKVNNAWVFDTLGVAYSQIGLHQNALPYFKQAVALKDDNPKFYFNLGASSKFVGEFEQARQAYQKVIELAPKFTKAHAALSSLGGISQSNNHITELETLYRELNSADDLLYVGHALAREYEALKEYPKAYHYLTASKQAKLTGLDYHFSQDQAMFSALQAMFSNKTLANKKGYPSNEAIFVVGMPRTGTTLVERIISKHTEVTSAGELQHFGLLLKKMSATTTNKVIDQPTIAAAAELNYCQLGQAYIESTRAITGKTAKFVDKMPLNVLYVGFILKALPQAKIICLDRNPLDTIVSNFRQLFAVNFSYYNYAYSLETTAQFYLEFKKLAELWLKLFPESFYLVNYEKLVNNPEEEAKKIVEFCGLTWQSACLDIHENSAPVATASAVQVRQPINNKSVGNWRKYQDYLDGIQTLLKNCDISY